MTTLTLEMPDEVRAVIDEARGDQDVASFLLTAGEQVAKRRLARRAPSEAEYHRQRAAEAFADSLPIEEFRQMVLAHIADDAVAEARAAR